MLPSTLFAIALGSLIMMISGTFSFKLSGGEKRLIGMFMIVFSRAKYILIDEPFNGVATVFKDEIKRIIKVQSEFKGFIITDHDYRNMWDLSIRHILLHDGGT